MPTIKAKLTAAKKKALKSGVFKDGSDMKELLKDPKTKAKKKAPTKKAAPKPKKKATTKPKLNGKKK